MEEEKERLYVLAPYYRAKSYAESLGVPRSRLVHVDKKESLWGREGEGKVLHVLSPVGRIEGYYDFIIEAKLSGFEIKYV